MQGYFFFFPSVCHSECCDNTEGVDRFTRADNLRSHRLSRDPFPRWPRSPPFLFHRRPAAGDAAPSVESSRHNPVRLLMFPCMFNACTRITTHRHMSAFFLFFFVRCHVSCFVQIGLLFDIAGSFERRFNRESSSGGEKVGTNNVYSSKSSP